MKSTQLAYNDYVDFERDYPTAEVIAEIDESADYEVDQTTILAEEAGTFLLATASGCSCWAGEWDVVRYDTVEELLADIGPTGESDNLYNPSFEGVKALEAQVEAWKSAAPL